MKTRQVRSILMHIGFRSLRFCLVVGVFLVITASSPVGACDYTIRDIGFVDRISPPFELWVVDHSGAITAKSKGTAKSAEAEIRGMLKDWNISVHVVAHSAIEMPPALRAKLLQGFDSTRELSAGTAASQEDLEMENVSQGEDSNAKAPATTCWLVDRMQRCRKLAELETALDAVEIAGRLNAELQSALGELLGTDTLASFAQVVIFEGETTFEGLDEILSGAEKAVRSISPLLPRVNQEPIVNHRIPTSRREAEQLRLWAIGLDDVSPQDTVLAVVYGRGHLAGKPLRNAEITLREVISQLTLVGASCECGTERSWINAPTLPFKWGGEQQVAASSQLKFDPTSKSVLLEVHRILGRDPTKFGRNPYGYDPIEEIVSGYIESELPTSNGEAGRDSLVPPASSGLQATVIQGDGWGFEEQSTAPEPPALVAIPPGKHSILKRKTVTKTYAVTRPAETVVSADTIDSPSNADSSSLIKSNFASQDQQQKPQERTHGQANSGSVIFAFLLGFGFFALCLLFLLKI